MLFLLETNPEGGAAQWILPVVLLVLVIGIFILNYFRSKKNQETMQNMVESLKVGDNVKTYSGLYGKIIEIVETTDGKVAILETGSEKNKGIFSIDINAIYGIDEKKPVVYDSEGKIIDAEEEAAKDKIKEGEEALKEEKKNLKKSKGKSKKPLDENLQNALLDDNTKDAQKSIDEKNNA